MTSRDRVLITLAHREPDRVPYNLRPSEEMRERLRRGQNNPRVDFSDFFGHDIRYVTVPLPKPPEDVSPCEWMPRPAPDDMLQAKEETRSLHDRGLAVCGAYACGVFEQAKAWYGDAETLTMPFEDAHRLEKELDRIAAWKMDVYAAYVRAAVDIVWMGDDLGMQQSLIMSPGMYRQWYRPCHERIVRHLRHIRPDVHIAFHCCGHVTPLIPDLIEIGMDILEAVQPECMDLAALKREFGRDLSFWGGIGAQSVLGRTTPDEVAEGVRCTLAIMSPGGGYIAAPCHTLTGEVSWETIVAFHEAVQKCGGYHRHGEQPR